MTTPDDGLRPDRESPTEPVDVVYVNPRVAGVAALLVVGMALGVTAAAYVGGVVGALTAGSAWCTLLGLLILGATGGDDNHGPT